MNLKCSDSESDKKHLADHNPLPTQTILKFFALCNKTQHHRIIVRCSKCVCASGCARDGLTCACVRVLCMCECCVSMCDRERLCARGREKVLALVSVFLSTPSLKTKFSCFLVPFQTSQFSFYPSRKLMVTSFRYRDVRTYARSKAVNN